MKIVFFLIIPALLYYENPVFFYFYSYTLLIYGVALWAKKKESERNAQYEDVNKDKSIRDTYPGQEKASEVIGRMGEEEVKSTLRLMRNKKFVLRNLILGSKGRTTEIDCLVISEGGIYVIESKHYSAKILGKINTEYWRVIYGNGKEFKLFNPIRQNDAHIRALSYKLKNILPRGRDEWFRSVIVFSDEANLDSVNWRDKELMVVHMDEMNHAVDTSIDHFKRKGKRHSLSPDTMKRIYDALYPYSEATQAKMDQHVANIKRRRGFESTHGNPSNRTKSGPKKKKKKGLGVWGLLVYVSMIFAALYVFELYVPF